MYRYTAENLRLDERFEFSEAAAKRLELRVKGELSVFIFKCPASGCVLKISCLRSYATPDCVVRLYYTRETWNMLFTCAALFCCNVFKYVRRNTKNNNTFLERFCIINLVPIKHKNSNNYAFIASCHRSPEIA